MNQLIARIEQGGETDTELAFDALPVLDGGNLEDVMRALAALSADRPELFLNMVKKRDWPPSRIERLVTMLPLSTVDRQEEKIRVVVQRIEGIRGVTSSELEAVRCATLDALTKSLSRLRSR